MRDLAELLELGDEEHPPSERKLQILTVACRLFATKGFDGASMRDIAEECGISKATLYHHFPDKNAILRLVSMGTTKSIYLHIAAHDNPALPPMDRLKVFMVETARFFEKFRWAWLASAAMFWNDPQVRRRKQRLEWRDKYEAVLRDILRAAVENGDMREDLDIALAGRLVSSATNWLTRWYSPGGPLTAVQIVEQFHDMIVGGFQKPR
ncbi:TetR/AcrR family transcriptional regulator [Rhodovarius crocodyli]|uniref:TetR/AcrR family transcriptional regulator n=1 Tax=Rhodovarius crocodyli TaxID=1979269 RepID=A0A437MJ26_9PROT|nr:TetR/AcrR family transcriptional regulator [Rhodovarius crocodyli]RVT97626.1 TetR/AcrR family transcriptional regulator [Rhodovarius crocodyli]